MTQTLEASTRARAAALRVLGRIAPEVDLTTLRADEDLREQLDIDSVDFLNFILGLHVELNVDVPEEDYAKLRSLDSCVAYLTAMQVRFARSDLPPRRS